MSIPNNSITTVRFHDKNNYLNGYEGIYEPIRSVTDVSSSLQLTYLLVRKGTQPEIDTSLAHSIKDTTLEVRPLTVII